MNFEHRFMEFGARSNLHVHHIDYRRIGNERFSDLMVVCCDCHELIHKRIDAMVSAKRTRRQIMDRLRPYCLRRLLLIHDLQRSQEHRY